jgi:hypothetical protein
MKLTSADTFRLKSYKFRESCGGRFKRGSIPRKSSGYLLNLSGVNCQPFVPPTSVFENSAATEPFDFSGRYEKLHQTM